MDFREAIATRPSEGNFRSRKSTLMAHTLPDAVVMDDTDAEQRRREKINRTVERAVPQLVQQWKQIAMDSDSGLLAKQSSHFVAELNVWAQSTIDPTLAPT